jgi:hypothetical protein
MPIPRLGLVIKFKGSGQECPLHMINAILLPAGRT